MVQKKLSQKKSQKTEEKNVQVTIKECEKNMKNELNGNKDTRKDANNNKVNKVTIENEFCKENHFVCSKFTDNQYNHVRESLSKLKDDKELSNELDMNHLDEILNDHHLLTRYMMRQRYDLEKQIEFIIKVLRWRQENHISMIKKELFPKEALELGPLFPYKKTKTGEIVCYLRFCLYPHTQIDFMDEFSIFQLYVINRLAIEQNTTWIWFFDFSNATKSNIDVKRSRFMIDVMNTYFPFANSRSIVYNLPWYLSFLKPLFFSFLPQHIKKVVGFYDSKNLNELIDQENLPPHLGGSGKLDDCEMYREFMKCDQNACLDEWVKNPPKEVELFKENANVDAIYETVRLFLQKQMELIESLKKKGVII